MVGEKVQILQRFIKIECKVYPFTLKPAVFVFLNDQIPQPVPSYMLSPLNPTMGFKAGPCDQLASREICHPTCFHFLSSAYAVKLKTFGRVMISPPEFLILALSLWGVLTY